MPFNHEKLKVYQRTLLFNAAVYDWVSTWDRKHAICDHLPRAAEGVLDSIVAASAAYSAMKAKNLDYALGSVLECAACLDLARVKHLLDSTTITAHKRELAELLRMLIGLRQSWTSSILRELDAPYGQGSERPLPKLQEAIPDILFHHEKLDAYAVAMHVAELFSSSQFAQNLGIAPYRRLDKLLTSIVLNIAEGNGRFSVADHRRFLTISHEAAGKLAARIDLHAVQKSLPLSDIESWKALLLRVSEMTAAMIVRLEARGSAADDAEGCDGG